MTPLVWLVTGCSSGFGLEFVRSILARGDKVIATVRGNAHERLQHLKTGGAAVLSLDVDVQQAQLDAKVKEAIAIYGGVDVLVNNAGYSAFGLVEDSSSKEFLDQLTTNFLGPLNLSRAILPHFRAKKSGTIIFNGSQLGIIGLPMTSVYTVSKHALEGLVDCLLPELQASSLNIRILILEAGHFRTEITNMSGDGRDGRLTTSTNPDYKAIYDIMMAAVATMHGTQPGDPHKAAEVVVDIVRGEGVAKGKAFPTRLPLGSDAVENLRSKAKEMLQICDEWEVVARSTDREDANPVSEKDATVGKGKGE